MLTPAPFYRECEYETISLSVRVGTTESDIAAIISPHKLEKFNITYQCSDNWDIKFVVKKKNLGGNIMQKLERSNIIVKYEKLPFPKEEKS